MSTANWMGNLGMGNGCRIERDMLGEMSMPADCYWGINTARALENFHIAGKPVHRELALAYGAVKLACCRTNRLLGVWDNSVIADAIEQASSELAAGEHLGHIVVDSLAGGAGTSLNMNVNEVLANRALEIIGKDKGAYDVISPLGDINRHQSTNDTFPTALRLAAIRGVRQLEVTLIALQEAFQFKEQEFAGVVKVGRTEMQDAVLITLGREMGAYAEAFNRDRWRVYKCEERLRVVNLGGTAVGTGLGAPRQFIFRVVDELKAITGVGFARAENLLEATQNADVFVEVSGILKACAVSLIKIANDLRLLASGPQAGIGEINLPPLQAGSSIMPGKVNPVAPEAALQAGYLVFGHDLAIASAAAAGNLELNHALPLIAHCLLESIDALTNAGDILAARCVKGVTANTATCRRLVDNATATVTALVGALGYERAAWLAATALATGKTIKEVAVTEGYLSSEQFEALISPEAVSRLGFL